MPYILTKTNGTILTTVQDASTDNSTSLTFVGRNYSGYGRPIEENFVRLLENFSNTTKPSKPVQGQFWFDNTPTVRRMKICYDGARFKDISNIPYNSTPPTDPNTGDLWWDSLNNQIKVYDSVNNIWIASQPFGGASSSWDFARIEDSLSIERDAISGYLGSTLTVIFSANRYNTLASLPINARFPKVSPGITLPNANPVTGSSANSTSTGFLLWGTAADALKTQKVDIAETVSTTTQYITIVSNTNGSEKLYTTSTFYFEPSTNVLNATASSALYADIAERYEADAIYEPGTVLMHGGKNEVTIAILHATTAVAGIVSTKPAYMMNSEAGSDETHPFIALKGRVPCKICGPVKKGDLLVASGYKPGYATKKQDSDSSDAVIGKALQDFAGPFGVVEVKV
jgi:hypothetical protein